MTIKQKLTSRKWWMSLAAFLASIGGAIAGITTENASLVTVGIICSAFSSAIYTFAEALVDYSDVTNKVAYTEATVETEG